MMYGRSSAVTLSFLSPNSITRSVTNLISLSFKVRPSSVKFFLMFAFPEVFPSAYFLFLPNLSGIKSLKYKFFLSSPSA